jgi:hypothetical protein
MKQEVKTRFFSWWIEFGFSKPVAIHHLPVYQLLVTNMPIISQKPNRYGLSKYVFL